LAEAPRPLTPRTRAISAVITALVRLIAKTARLKVHNEATLEAAVKNNNGAILVTWHGRTLIPLYWLRHRGYWALVSLSKDGDIQARNFAAFGFQIVRGSTGRGGDRAAVQILRALKSGGTLAFTPDGPRGPTHEVQPGVVFFAQRSGKPIVPVGVAASPNRQLPTWDSYLLPGLFARVAMVWGEPIFIAPEEDLIAAATRVKIAMNAAEDAAEQALKR
jgi:lysophospholipid acyltransferase (LPLAT)-like uncharacterized protein